MTNSTRVGGTPYRFNRERGGTRPISFSDPMTLALLAGHKTQTRRLRGLGGLNEAPDDWALDRWQEYRDGSLRAVFDHVASGEPNAIGIRCPYGQLGDLLYVREAWQYADWTEEGDPFIRYRADGTTRLHDVDMVPEEWSDRLTSIWAELSSPDNLRATDGLAADRRWRPSIHMPRWASRIALEITDVRVERLHAITEADAIAEGVMDGGCLTCGNSSHPAPCGCSDPRPDYRDAFVRLWDSINGKREGCRWADNPWLWCLTFRCDNYVTREARAWEVAHGA